ncbi:MAG: hypothetical protein QME81_05260 [bacterium]|nr:hypothetical protein [bacterium]
MAKILKKRKWLLFSKFLLLKTPSATEIDQKIEEIKPDLKRGREEKGYSGNLKEALRHFENAHRKLVELEEIIWPAIIRDRVFAILLTVAGIIAGLVLSNL